MKIGIMQPYFFPYIGYFSLIKNTDKFIIFDTPQFIRHGWIERNRILKQDGNWQYIAVPLMKHSQTTAIRDIVINNKENWKNKILAQLIHYKKKAPYYYKTIKLLNEIFEFETDSITDLNTHVLKKVCEHLEIDFNYEIFSRMNLQIEEVNAPDEWALNICKALGNIDEYWNPEGGTEFFDRTKYEKAGIKLYFQKMNIQPYLQGDSVKETGLSIIDVLMFNSKEEILEMMNNYELI
ncbi:MAG: WbqC family protein [bacterium]|nr:WbqC family protein [bacterium]